MSTALLPRRVFDGFGYSKRSVSAFLEPRSTPDVQSAFQLAQEAELRVALRGAGRSYGDAAMNGDHLVLDMTQMRRVLRWDPITGVADVEPGVTIADLWRVSIGDGWWPAVVPGTMFPTLGGCVAMNVHGKNQYRLGGTGDQVVELDLVTPDGRVQTLSRTQDAPLFHAVIAGFGMLGAVTRIRLQLKRVHAARLDVWQVPARSLDEQFELFEEHEARSDYLVSWVDCLTSGASLGRGQLHRAEYLHEGADPWPFDPERQALPTKAFGLPLGVVGLGLKLFQSRAAMGLVNLAKYLGSAWGPKGVYRQSHVAFHFLFDHLPGYREAYRPHGFIQFQPFLPKATAKEAMRELLRLGQRRGLPSVLGVLKRHRPDDFLLSHALDGYSLALDFPIGDSGHQALWALGHEMTELVLDAGGRFYPAKDALLRPQDFVRAWGADRVEQFRALRRRVDPGRVLRTEWAERVGVDAAACV